MGGEDGHSFSLELRSKKFVKSFSLSDKGREGVLIEGVLGEFGLMEDAILLIHGSHGTLRVDLTEGELRKMLAMKKKE
jgi:hypothetical protein